MTKPQIWVAAFLVLFILLFLLQRATNEPGSTATGPMSNPVSQDMAASENMSPAELINKLGCRNCHGPDLAGTKMAPSLIGIKQYWSKDQLINYLRNPSSFMDSDRFQQYRQQYPNMVMPSFNNINVQQLGKISEYLLNQ